MTSSCRNRQKTVLALQILEDVKLLCESPGAGDQCVGGTGRFADPRTPRPLEQPHDRDIYARSRNAIGRHPQPARQPLTVSGTATLSINAQSADIEVANPQNPTTSQATLRSQARKSPVAREAAIGLFSAFRFANPSRRRCMTQQRASQISS